MAFSLIANTSGVGGGNGGTSGSIDTTGANLIVIEGHQYGGFPLGSVSDSKGNTWTQAVDSGNGGGTESTIWYVSAPTVGSGHTFTNSGSNIFGGIDVEAWSGAAASSPLDVTNHNSSSGTTIQPGSATPSQANSLIVTGVCGETGSGAFSINSGFTISNQTAYSNGVAEGGGLAYFLQGTAAAINPIWTLGSAVCSAVIAVFKPAAGGGGGGGAPTLPPQIIIFG